MEYINYSKKKRGQWAARCCWWCLLLAWKRGRSTLPGPFRAARNHAAWCGSITSPHFQEERKATFLPPASGRGFLPRLRWHTRGAAWGPSVWDRGQAAICSQASSCSAHSHTLGRHHRRITTLACHRFWVQRLSLFKASWLLTSSPQGLTQNPEHFRSSLNVTPSFQPTSRAERDCEAAGDCDIKFRDQRTKNQRKISILAAGAESWGVGGQGVRGYQIGVFFLKKFILK